MSKVVLQVWYLGRYNLRGAFDLVRRLSYIIKLNVGW